MSILILLLRISGREHEVHLVNNVLVQILRSPPLCHWHLDLINPGQSRWLGAALLPPRKKHHILAQTRIPPGVAQGSSLFFRDQYIGAVSTFAPPVAAVVPDQSPMDEDRKQLGVSQPD